MNENNESFFFDLTCKIHKDKVYDILGNQEYLKLLAKYSNQSKDIIEYSKSKSSVELKDFISGLSYLLPLSGLLVANFFERIENTNEFKELFVLSLDRYLNTADAYSGYKTFKTLNLDNIISELNQRLDEFEKEKNIHLDKSREYELLIHRLDQTQKENEILEKNIQTALNNQSVYDSKLKENKERISKLEESIQNLTSQIQITETKSKELEKAEKDLLKTFHPIQEKSEELSKNTKILEDSILNLSKQNKIISEQNQIKQKDLDKAKEFITKLEKEKTKIIEDFKKCKTEKERAESEIRPLIQHKEEIKTKIDQVNTLLKELKGYINPNDESKRIMSGQ